SGLLTELDDTLPLRRVWLIGGSGSGIPGHLDARAMPEARGTVAAHAVQPGDIATILYTSGTTGSSKGVCCPHAQCFWWGVNTAELLEIGADDRLLTCLPLFHINALNTFYQALLTGAPLVIEPRFSASE